MEDQFQPYKKPMHLIGYALIVINLIVFTTTGNEDRWFFEDIQIWYLFPSGFVYFIAALFTKRDLFVKSIGLSLLYISCFSLDREVNLFAEFTPLQTALMIISQLTMLALSFIDKMPNIPRAILLIITGVSMFFTLHMAIYLAPAYGFGIIGMIILGLGFLAFVPLVSFIHFIRLIRSQELLLKMDKKWFWLGISFPTALFIVYLGVYANFKTKVDDLTERYEQSAKILSKELFVRQYIEISSVQEYFLQNNYEVFHRDLLFRTRGKEHKPMGMAASLLLGNIDLSSTETDVIFNNLYQHRHENNPRFWTGKDVSTDSVKTEIDVFPEYRIAYVEKVIDLSCDCENTWPSTQEGIYTFHLPEGAIGTSLSLWIDGIEEKAALSTKNKVETAYSTIVGRESRDPAMMNWKEGNRLVVNVFPVSDNLPRTLKVGFTIPIKTADDMCYLSDVYFQGPDFSSGRERLKIRFHGKMDLNKVNNHSSLSQKERLFTHNGPIQKEWFLSWPKPKLSKETFAFKGNTYAMAEAPILSTIPFKPQIVILDLNVLWSKDEIQDIKDLFKGNNLWTYDDKNNLIPIKYGEENPQIDEINERRFSIFPNSIMAKENLKTESTLVITKQDIEFPIISDIKGTYLQESDKPFFLYQLGSSEQINSKIYKESGLANVAHGDLKKFEEMLKSSAFPAIKTGENNIVVSANKTEITRVQKADSTATTKGPDHLMRLFNFGLLMENLKPYYLKRDSVSEAQIALAQAAFVVSPFSSLVCLESAQDYERFDIEKPDNNSLGNASILDNGGVPEPHEWALIALAAVFFSFLLYKRFF